MPPARNSVVLARAGVAKRIGSRKACVAVARKLAIIMHRMWVEETDFRFGKAAVKGGVPDIQESLVVRRIIPCESAYLSWNRIIMPT